MKLTLNQELKLRKFELEMEQKSREYLLWLVVKQMRLIFQLKNLCWNLLQIARASNLKTIAQARNDSNT